MLPGGGVGALMICWLGGSGEGGDIFLPVGEAWEVIKMELVIPVKAEMGLTNCLS